MMIKTLLLFFSYTLVSFGKEAPAIESPALPAELSDYKLSQTPEPSIVLKKGDRLAICGDSITEQKQYSVIMETYLTACLPELEITSRQYGWSGERAGGFLDRMENDVLRFKPTVATTCYGMNDFGYVVFDENLAAEYRDRQSKIVDKFKSAGVRVVVGSSGIIDSVPDWVEGAKGEKKDLNIALSKFRNIALEVAKAGEAGFGDVFRPMLIANLAAKKTYGEAFQVSGKDGVHPGWAGHAIMAYAFLKALGVDGDMGSITYNESENTATGKNGHEVLNTADGSIKVRSSRIPFCPGPGVIDNDDSLRAGMALVAFDDALNRFIFKIESPKSKNYSVTWGNTTLPYTAAQLEAGINLAKDFQDNPLVIPFKKIQDAVAVKQAFETKQIKDIVHGEEGKEDMEAAFARTETEREVFVKNLAATIQAAEYSIVIQAQ
ncbi:MAG: SGNH/GDSL hydrolase family protein [Armatimonadetes bacterium]|nr:SGNH/GDSL hydrolase family protein [Akkermansiaceae bacterium]